MTEPVVEGPPGSDDAPSGDAARAKRRRGSRGGRNRPRQPGDRTDQPSDTDIDAGDAGSLADSSTPASASTEGVTGGGRPSTPPRAAASSADRSPTSSASGSGARPEAEATAARTGAAPRASASAADGTAGVPDTDTAAPRTTSETGSTGATGVTEPPDAPADASGSAGGRPKIGDTRPAPAGTADGAPDPDNGTAGGSKSANRRRRGGRGRGSGGGNGAPASGEAREPGGRNDQRSGSGRNAKKGDGRGGRQGGGPDGGRQKNRPPQPIEAVLASAPIELDEDDLKRRSGRERKGRPVGRYLMAVSVGPKATQIAVLEGRNLIEHYVSRPADDISQIHGNIYIGRVQNVLPGMEAAFVDIATPKNAVLYRGDVQHDPDDVDAKVSQQARIEDILKPKQTIICQVTKNPIAHKGARLTQEVSLPGRFVVLIPNSTTYGISKRLADDERKRLRGILDKVRPKGHGLIVRTAASGVTATEIERDVLQLSEQWNQIEALAAKTQAPALLYREPDMAVRVIREELNDDYRAIIIDEPKLFEEIRGYVAAISPALADRVQYYDRTVEPLSIYERHHVHEQLHRALDRKVWLPSGGSLIIEHTEALTVIDVNTGKNVGSSNLEETVFRNNLEAAEEIAKQLRLRDIGGIIVIDFIDMEIDKNRKAVIKAFREALARDKTRTQAFDITDLGLVEMTRKRIGEGLLESFATTCPECEGRGITLDQDLIV
jgi:ribonuclease E